MGQFSVTIYGHTGSVLSDNQQGKAAEADRQHGEDRDRAGREAGADHDRQAAWSDDSKKRFQGFQQLREIVQQKSAEQEQRQAERARLAQGKK